jgi:hypothetical protein
MVAVSPVGVNLLETGANGLESAASRRSEAIRARPTEITVTPPVTAAAATIRADRAQLARINPSSRCSAEKSKKPPADQRS